MTVALPDVDGLTATDILDALDFHEPVGCGHSQHAIDREWHDDGPATHYVRVRHACAARPGLPPVSVYPACAMWVYLVEAVQTRRWLCRHCRQVYDGRDVFTVVCQIGG
jgi:hypothetical protein